MRLARLLALAPIVLGVALVLATYRVAMPCYRLEPAADAPVALPNVAVAEEIRRTQGRSWFPLDDAEHVDADYQLGPFALHYASASYHNRPEARVWLTDPRSCRRARLAVPVPLDPWMSRIRLRHLADTDLYAVAVLRQGTSDEDTLPPLSFRRVLARPVERASTHGVGSGAIALGALALAAARGRPALAPARWVGLALLVGAVAVLAIR